METVNGILKAAAQYEVLLWWLFALSAALLLLTPVFVAWVIVQLPSDYFTATSRRRAIWQERYPVLRPVMLIAKNLAGMVLILAGLVMLVAPGQGLLTVVAGLLLLDFSGKFRFERWLATRRPMWQSINWLRQRAGREPLKRPVFGTSTQ